jgi:hypothetical protein
MRTTFAGLLEDIRGAISRGKGTFGIGHSTLPAPEAPFVLILGALRAVTVNREVREARGGYIVSLGLTVAQLEQLRDHCSQLLEEHRGPVADKRESS